MIIAILALITSLAIAGIAAWYSITGLAAIFASSVIPIMIMGGALEVGKLVTASWLYRNWKETSFLLKTYLSAAVLVLMFITSMGIFGFLSKAHLEHTVSAAGNTTIQLENYQRQIDIEKRTIANSEKVMAQLDQTVQTLMDFQRIRGADGAIAVRNSQAAERNKLNEEINVSTKKIDELSALTMPLLKEQVKMEADVGPLKYISELIYGEEKAKDHFDEAVRWIILLIIFAFDPLAVLLLIAANQSLVNRVKDEPKFFELGDDGLRLVSESEIYKPDEEQETAVEEEDPAADPEEFGVFYEATDDDEPEVFETVYEDEDIIDMGGVSPSDRLEPPRRALARVPYNAGKGLVEESPGR